jgi:hypothetical protein
MNRASRAGVELAVAGGTDVGSYNPKLWIDPNMKEAAYPSV